MEISSEKSKTMVNSRDGSVHANIRMNGEILEEVDKFKYLGVTITKDGTSEAGIHIRLATSTSALIRFKNIWTSKKLALKQNAVSIKHCYSQYYSMDAKLRRLLKRWRMHSLKIFNKYKSKVQDIVTAQR